MMPMGLNHMTMAQSSTIELLDLAQSLGCVGVELRNDLSGDLFDGNSPEAIRDEAGQRGLRILALAEVYGFNDNTDETRAKVLALATQACNCGAEAIALIPRIANAKVDRTTQRTLLHDALKALKPVLEDVGVTALIEPLGFEHSSLRLKADAVAVLNDLGRPECFALIHDTFHHTLAGETEFFANATRVVHISGVADKGPSFSQMEDVHRGLVDRSDRLGNVAQIARLQAQGFDGPFSFEAFAPDIHELNDPTAALSASTAFINSHVADFAA